MIRRKGKMEFSSSGGEFEAALTTAVAPRKWT
jgi:hypothetical protein